MIDKLETFLIESNAIEDVWDDSSYLKANNAYHCLDKCDNLSPWYIKNVHDILMDGKLQYPELGEWRKCNVRVGYYIAPEWYIVPELMENWCDIANTAKTWKDIQHYHIMAEKIHPFIDGNGRVFRIIMNWQRVKLRLPIKIIYEKKKQAYYKWFV